MVVVVIVEEITGEVIAVEEEMICCL